MDGLDLREVDPRSVRRQIGLVPQDPVLFGMTVAENIAVSMPDATQEQVERAAVLAYAHDFIMQLPDGYETMAGERGASLSGGQRQRIAIARAILADPRILILDEATSALDTESEAAIHAALQRIRAGRTVILIAGRPPCLVDRIIVMDQGRVVQDGTTSGHAGLPGDCICWRRVAGGGDGRKPCTARSAPARPEAQPEAAIRLGSQARSVWRWGARPGQAGPRARGGQARSGQVGPCADGAG